LQQKKTNLAFILSNVSTARETIKQIIIYVLIGITVSTKIGMVRNNRNSVKVEYSNVVIL